MMRECVCVMSCSLDAMMMCEGALRTRTDDGQTHKTEHLVGHTSTTTLVARCGGSRGVDGEYIFTSLFSVCINVKKTKEISYKEDKPELASTTCFFVLFFATRQPLTLD
jgi:hypothetical protein